MDTLNILFADGTLVVAVKPVGVSSEAGENSMPSLLSTDYGNVYCVHRLDTAVGGVMVYARTKTAADSLCGQIRAGNFKKEYRAVVAGVPEPREGTLRDFLYHDRVKNKTFAVTFARVGAKEAILDYRVNRSFPYDGIVCSDVTVFLKTGRTHQIRVQFASRRMPLVGDGKYGSRIKGKIALFCEKISFLHPTTGREMSFHAELPDHFPKVPHLETERKYLIAMPDVDKLLGMAGTEVWKITQTYLVTVPGVTRRVREVESAGEKRYYYTEKVRLTNESAQEEEREITAEEYRTYFSERDPSLNTIEKTRFRIPCDGFCAEVDVYPFWKKTAVLETEYVLGKEVPAVPDFLRVLRDVTDDLRYKNVRLAREIPNETV